MIEPVAYIRKTSGGTYISQTPIGDNYGSKTDKTLPLYTAEQLHPRVKMTKKQYEEWRSAIRSIYPVNLYELFNLIFNATEQRGEYAGMRDIFSFDKGQKKLAQLWSDFDPFNPEETIEIVPNMKWFVRVDSQIPLPDENIYLDDELIVYPHYDSPKSSAHQFDTKSEAEKWTNPLTEVVQLPVEGE